MRVQWFKNPGGYSLQCAARGGSARKRVLFLGSQYTKGKGKIIILEYERVMHKIQSNVKEMASNAKCIKGCQILVEIKTRNKY